MLAKNEQILTPSPSFPHTSFDIFGKLVTSFAYLRKCVLRGFASSERTGPRMHRDVHTPYFGKCSRTLFPNSIELVAQSADLLGPSSAWT